MYQMKAVVIESHEDVCNDVLLSVQGANMQQLNSSRAPFSPVSQCSQDSLDSVDELSVSPAIRVDKQSTAQNDSTNTSAVITEYHDSICEGDGMRVMRCWYLMLPLFKAAKRKNYALEALKLLWQYNVELSPRQLVWSRFVNTHGKPGCKVPCDLQLPLKYSKTPDHFPAIFFKSVACVIAFPLSYLFYMSMQSGKVPSDLKIAYVCPIFKKGDRKLPSNYRPVSLTSICGKVMESASYLLQ